MFQRSIVKSLFETNVFIDPTKNIDENLGILIVTMISRKIDFTIKIKLKMLLNVDH